MPGFNPYYYGSINTTLVWHHLTTQFFRFNPYYYGSINTTSRQRGKPSLIQFQSLLLWINQYNQKRYGVKPIIYRFQSLLLWINQYNSIIQIILYISVKVKIADDNRFSIFLSFIMIFCRNHLLFFSITMPFSFIQLEHYCFQLYFFYFTQ